MEHARALSPRFLHLLTHLGSGLLIVAVSMLGPVIGGLLPGTWSWLWFGGGTLLGLVLSVLLSFGFMSDRLNPWSVRAMRCAFIVTGYYALDLRRYAGVSHGLWSAGLGAGWLIGYLWWRWRMEPSLLIRRARGW